MSAFALWEARQAYAAACSIYSLRAIHMRPQLSISSNRNIGVHELSDDISALHRRRVMRYYFITDKIWPIISRRIFQGQKRTHLWRRPFAAYLAPQAMVELSRWRNAIPSQYDNTYAVSNRDFGIYITTSPYTWVFRTLYRFPFVHFPIDKNLLSPCLTSLSSPPQTLLSSSSRWSRKVSCAHDPLEEGRRS